MRKEALKKSILFLLVGSLIFSLICLTFILFKKNGVDEDSRIDSVAQIQKVVVRNGEDETEVLFADMIDNFEVYDETVKIADEQSLNDYEDIIDEVNNEYYNMQFDFDTGVVVVDGEEKRIDEIFGEVGFTDIIDGLIGDIEVDGNAIKVVNPYSTNKLIVDTDRDLAEIDFGDDLKLISKVSETTYIVEYENAGATKDGYELLKSNSKGIEVNRNIKMKLLETVSTSDIVENENETKKPAVAETVFNNDGKLYYYDEPELGLLKAKLSVDSSKLTNEIKVVVLDSGVQMDHPALQGRLDTENAYDVDGKDSDPEDIKGHGTHVAGIIAKNTPSNVKIVPIKIMNDNGECDSTTYIEGLSRSVNIVKADIINMSLGFEIDPSMGQYVGDTSILRTGYNNGILMYAATGNSWSDGVEYVDYPASSDYVHGVGAVYKTSYNITSFSQRGPQVDYVGLGYSIMSTYPTNKIQADTGTSMATPYIAAAAALVKTEHPEFSREQVVNYMNEHSKDLGDSGKDEVYGYGLVEFSSLFSTPEIIKYTGGSSTNIRVVSENLFNYVAVSDSDTEQPSSSQWKRTTESRYKDITINNMKDGVQYYLWTKDSNGNVSAIKIGNVQGGSVVEPSTSTSPSVSPSPSVTPEPSDTTAPVLIVSYSDAAIGEPITVTITANEEVQVVDGWIISEDKKSMSKTYNESKSEYVTVYDLAGNRGYAYVAVDISKTVKYTVEYYYDGVKNNSSTVSLTGDIGSIIRDYEDKIQDGYVLDSTTGLPLTLVSDESKNVIKVYYIRNSYDYSIEYYYDDEIDSSKTVTGTKRFGEVISNYEDKNIVGFKLDRVENELMEITSDVSKNVMKVYYIADYLQTKTLSYRVNYYKDNILVSEDCFVVSNEVYVLEPDEIAVNVSAINTLDKYEGYNYIETVVNDMIIHGVPNIVEDGASINVYYKKRDDLVYKVKYLDKDSGEELADTKIVSNVTFGENVVAANEMISIEGYDYSGSDKNSIIVGLDGNANIISLYYTRKTGLSYSVKYVDRSSGNLLAATKIENGVAYGYEVNVDEEIIFIDGYTCDGVSVDTFVVGTGVNELIIYYIRQTGLSYEVNYLEKGSNISIEDKLVVEGKTFGDIVTAADELIEIDGFKFDSDSGDIEITTGKNVINLYFVREEFDYRVEYYYDGKIDESKTEVLSAEFEKVINSYNDKNITGYKLDKAEGVPLTISFNSDNNVVKVYYVLDKDNTREISYSVDVTKDGEKDDYRSFVESKNVQILDTDGLILDIDRIQRIVDDGIDGYKIYKIKVNDEEVSELPDSVFDGSVIKLEFVIRDDLEFTVNYYEEGTTNKIAESKTYEGMIFGTDIEPFAEVLDIDGFEYYSYSGDEVISTGENVINLYYVRKKYNYTVEYYYEGVIDSSKTESFTKEFGELISHYNDKNIDGYMLSRITGLPLTISSNEDSNIIKIYYIIDSGNTKNVSYSVEVIKDGKEDYDKSFVDFETVKFVDLDEIKIDKERIQKIIDDGYDGYRIDKILVNDEEVSVLPDIVSNESVIKLEFVKKSDLSYTVNYWEKDTTSKISKSKIEENVVFNSVVNASEEEIEIEGFEFESNSGDIIISTGENVINLYYVRKEFNYTIEYYYDEKIDESKTEVLSAKFEKRIDLDIDQNIIGYKFDRVEGAPLIISSKPSDNVIKVYYTSDLTQIKKISYSVEYCKEGEVVEEDTQIFEKDVWVLSDEDIEVDKDSIDLENKYVGYLCDEESKNILDRVEDGSIIKINYVRKDCQLIIRYLEEDTEVVLHDENVQNGKYGDEYITSDLDIEGYELVDEDSDRVGILDEETVVIIYYYKEIKKDDSVPTVDPTPSVSPSSTVEPSPSVAPTTTVEPSSSPTDTSTPSVTPEPSTEPTLEPENDDNKIKVTFEFRDKFNNEKLSDDLVIEGNENEGYAINEVEFDGYELVNKIEDISGKFPDEDKIYTFYYSRIMKVVVKYVERNSDKELAEAIIIEGYEGDSYETESKKLEYYKLNDEPKNAKGKMVFVGKDEIEVKYEYDKKEFNLNMKKRITDILVNGSSRMNGNGEIAKIEVNSKYLNSTEIIVKYLITVDNDGEIIGRAKIGVDIPDGMALVTEQNVNWLAFTKSVSLETDDIEPGKSKSYELVLKWIPDESNLGVKDVSAKIMSTSNDAGFDEVTEKDNENMTEIVIAVATGQEEKKDYSIVNILVLILLVTFACEIIRSLKRREN